MQFIFIASSCLLAKFWPRILQTAHTWTRSATTTGSIDRIRRLVCSTTACVFWQSGVLRPALFAPVSPRDPNIGTGSISSGGDSGKRFGFLRMLFRVLDSLPFCQGHFTICQIVPMACESVSLEVWASSLTTRSSSSSLLSEIWWIEGYLLRASDRESPNRAKSPAPADRKFSCLQAYSRREPKVLFHSSTISKLILL